jgi:hypothetical protein
MLATRLWHTRGTIFPVKLTSTGSVRRSARFSNNELNSSYRDIIETKDGGLLVVSKSEVPLVLCTKKRLPVHECTLNQMPGK